jgi:hypothetical protein
MMMMMFTRRPQNSKNDISCEIERYGQNNVAIWIRYLYTAF